MRIPGDSKTYIKTTSILREHQQPNFLVVNFLNYL